MKKNKSYYDWIEYNLAYRLDYGDLAAKYPTETYTQLKARRQRNFLNFKASCDLLKTMNGTVRLPARRVEFHLDSSDKILLREAQNDKLTVLGAASGSTQVVCYPYVPTKDVNIDLFNLQHNTSLTLKKISFNRDHLKKYETYSCVLKKNSNAKLVEILGTIRPEFWDELVVGQPIFYGWAVSVQGETNTISSWDSVAKTITLTNNISGAVSNNMSGQYVKFGSYFKEDVSIADYTTYGDMWYLNEGMDCISSVNSFSGNQDTLINFDDVKISGFESNINISSGACKLEANNLFIERCQLGLTFFSQDQANGQMLKFTGDMTFNNCGYNVAGAIFSATAGNILGGGGYIHPNIQLRGDGNLILTNNVAAAFRQFSSSGTKPVGVGYYSHFSYVYARNNTEYDFLTSNSLPVTVDYIDLTNTLNVGGDLEITEGFINSLGCTTQSQPNIVATTITLNDCEITGPQQFAWSTSRGSLCDVYYNDCVFKSKTTSLLNVIFTCETSLNSLNINGGSYIKGASGGSYYTFGIGTNINGLTENSSFIRTQRFESINISNFTTELLFGKFFSKSSGDNSPTEKAFPITITDSNILMHLLENLSNASPFSHSYKYNLIRTKIICHAYPGYIWNINVTPKVGITTVSILSQGYNKYPFSSAPTLNNVLQLDYDYNEYNVNAGTVKIVGPVQYAQLVSTLTRTIASNMISGDIIVHAIGGDVVFSAWDAITNPDSNIKNNYTCLSGQSCKLTADNKEVLATSAVSATSKTLGTGNGTNKIFSGIITPDADKLIEVGSATLTAGGVTGTIDSNGVITGAGIVVGYVDLFGGAFYIEFTNAVANATPVTLDYNKYNGWKWTGTWTVSAL
jgi:hypothetical protein